MGDSGRARASLVLCLEVGQELDRLVNVCLLTTQTAVGATDQLFIRCYLTYAKERSYLGANDACMKEVACTPMNSNLCDELSVHHFHSYLRKSVHSQDAPLLVTVLVLHYARNGQFLLPLTPWIESNADLTETMQFI